ncbi:hypothetical protein A1353_10255 [Methylomonas methanica]|uniref:DUF6438 domain-containing protein n=1 Tax=Methylomonas methanica TaxID=421 RepID=A0A177MJS8_METMH|nr:DUF6438 domain-containing protein [Methylomonas methanica]OAI06058.1 hypothetical protein A1353_10255 [Methylomonas methanica]
MNLHNMPRTEMQRNSRWILSLMVLWISSTGSCLAKSPPVLIFDEHGVKSAAWLNYQIELYSDGSVHYHGVDDVNVIGDHYGKIKPKQVQYLVDLYQKLYQKHQQARSEFMVRYENRHNLGQDEKHHLERYKREYIDDRDWDTAITYNNGSEISKIAPVGAHMNEFISILNDMINLEPWLCFPKHNPRRKYCPVLNHSPNYQLLMDDIK